MISFNNNNDIFRRRHCGFSVRTELRYNFTVYHVEHISLQMKSYSAPSVADLECWNYHEEFFDIPTH